MEAVELYASVEDQKAHYFQDKLTKLLSNSKIYDKIEKESPKEKSVKTFDNLLPTSSSKSHFNSKRQMELNLIMGEKKSENITKNLLHVYGASYSVLDNIVKGNLKSQESDITKRYYWII